MKNLKKILCVTLALVFVLSLSACTKSYKVHRKGDFKDWFNLSLIPTYDSFVKSDDGKDAPSPTLSLLIASDKYINSVFDFIDKGTQPKQGKVEEKDGVYTYSFGSFSQVFEFNAKKSSIKVTMIQGGEGDSRTEFIAVFSERSGNFFIQYLAPDFEDYYEVEFTAKSGKVIHETGISDLPYSIFDQDIPETFAK